MASTVSAADLPSRKYAPVTPTPLAPIFTWTGFYVGVNGGYAIRQPGQDLINGFGDAFVNAIFNTVGVRSSIQSEKRSSDSFTGGGQIGYNYQLGGWVLGLEADMNYVHLSTSHFVGNSTVAIARSATLENKIQWYGTLRPRIGFAVTDRLMVYATGGLAYGEVKGRLRETGLGRNALAIAGSRSRTQTGYTLGGGLEYAVTDNVSLKAEYAYVDLGKSRYVIHSSSFANSAVVTNYNASESTRFHVVRAGINYRF